MVVMCAGKGEDDGRKSLSGTRACGFFFRLEVVVMKCRVVERKDIERCCRVVRVCFLKGNCLWAD